MNTRPKLLAFESDLYRFSERGRVLHVLTPNTPSAWKNYFFNDHYYLELDQCAQGQAQMIDGTKRKLTGTYRYFYIKDEETGEVWNPTVRPLNAQLDHYECIHRTTHSDYIASAQGILSTVSAFVPLEGTRELWKVTLTNDSASPRNLSLFALFPFEDGGLMNAKGWFEATKGCCYGYYFPYHATYEGKERLQKKKTLAYLFSTVAPTSGESNLRKFLGADDLFRIPVAVARGECSGQPCNGELPVGALHHRLHLAPGQSLSIGYCAGIENHEAEVAALRNQVSTTAQIDAELDRVKAHHENLFGALQIHTPEPLLDGFVNSWLQKQTVFQSRMNRLCFEFPIRNQLQDYMGYSLTDPEAALAMLRTRFALQDSSGYLQQWWTEGDKLNHELCVLDFKDGGIWLVLCTLIAISQTGTHDFLHEPYPFRNSDENATVLEHLRRAVAHLAGQRGSHGLCLMGDGDWTDPINGPGRGGKGESTWTTCALGFAAQMLARTARCLNDLQLADDCDALNGELKAAIHEHAWNGSWFVVGFDDDGNSFGNPEEEEGRIFINSQTWPIIAGYVTDERMGKTLEAIGRMSTPAGVLLSWPAFTKWNPVWGRISLKLAGTSENGSIYCHAAMFKALADVCRGDADAALEEILRTLPVNADNPPSRNTQCPIFIPNYYFGLQDSPDFGQSSRNHRTGTAPWMLWVLVEHLLASETSASGIPPCRPTGWESATITRRRTEEIFA